MNKSIFFVAVATVAALTLFAHQAQAGADAGPAVEVLDPYALATPPGAPNGAAYMTIENTGDSEVVVTGASSSVSRSAEIHGHSRQGGMMMMKPVGELIIGPGEKAHLRPGEMHLMLIGLDVPLREGDEVVITLTVIGIKEGSEDEGEEEVEVRAPVVKFR